LSKCLALKFQESQALKDINESIKAGHGASECANPVRHKWRTSLILLGEKYDIKYKKTRTKKDLDVCIDYYEGLADFLTLDDPARIRPLGHLSTLLYVKYNSTQSKKDLEDAIEYGRKALDSMDTLEPRHTSRSKVLDLLSTSNATKFSLTQSPKDLEAAISFGEDAIKAMSQEDPAREEAVKRVKQLKVEGFYKPPMRDCL